MFNINIIDILMVILLIYGLVRGYLTGLIRILFDALAVSVSFYVANSYYGTVATFLSETIHLNVPWVGGLSYFLTYLASFALFEVWGILITKLFATSTFGTANKVSGMLLNGIKWGMIGLIAVLLFAKLPAKPLKERVVDSYTYKLGQNVLSLPSMKQMLPGYIHSSI